MKTVIKTIVGLGIALSAIATFSEASYGEQRFSCDKEEVLRLNRFSII